MRRRPAAMIVASVVLVASAQAASAGPPDLRPPKPPRSASAAVAGVDASVLVHPIVSAELAEAATAVSQALDGDHAFGGVSVDLERDTLVIEWFGPDSERLVAALDDATALGVTAEVRSVPVAAGELRDAARNLLGVTTASGTVVGAGPAADGASLDVTLDPDGSAIGLRSQHDAAQTLTDLAGFPVTVVDRSGIAPATRLEDSHYIGGARVMRYPGGGACTTGFAVTNGTRRGLMHAAHCGPVDQRWVRNGTDAAGKTWLYMYGTTTVRDTAYDGAIIESNYSQPYVYIGTYDNANGSVYPISGVVTPFEGAEICFEGSFSGQSCGNVVTHNPYYWNFGGDLNGIQGVRTVNAAGTPAFGNGDSGGPGLVIVGTASSARAMAGTIISGMPSDSAGTTCQGVPGSSSGRKCSVVGFSTEAWRIALDTGWTIHAVP